MGRATDLEDLAQVLVETARQHLRMRRMPVALDAGEDVANEAALRGVIAHKRGYKLVVLFRGLFAKIVEAAAVDAARRARNAPRPFSDLARDDAGADPVAAFPDASMPLDELMDARATLHRVVTTYPELRAYLEGASEKVRLVATLALRNRPSREIAEAVSASLGTTMSDAAVRKIISRDLTGRFPTLAFLWEKAARSDSAGRERTQRDRGRAARRALADQAFDEHVARATALVRVIAGARRRLGAARSDWSAVALAVQEQLRKPLTSSEAKRTWQVFVASLPDDASGADR